MKDLYKRFKRLVVLAVKWISEYSINRILVIDFKQVSKSDYLKIIRKILFQNMKSLSRSIRSSAVRVIYELKTSQIDFF